MLKSCFTHFQLLHASGPQQLPDVWKTRSKDILVLRAMHLGTNDCSFSAMGLAGKNMLMYGGFLDTVAVVLLEDDTDESRQVACCHVHLVLMLKDAENAAIFIMI